MGNQINCPGCLARQGDTIAMQPDKQGWFKCPECGGEYWPRDEKAVVKWIQTKQQQGNTYVSLSQQPGVHIAGGGSAAGKSKKAGKKKSLQQLYQELYKQT